MSRRIYILIPIMAFVCACSSVWPTVDFESTPHLRSGDKVLMGSVTIGSVLHISKDSRGAHVTLTVDPRRLPPRAVFLATMDPDGVSRLEVFPLPQFRDASPNTYFGVTSEAELAIYLGAERSKQIWSEARRWILNTLAAEPPARKVPR